MHPVKVETEEGESQVDLDLGRREPVFLVAAIEHELQRSDTDRKKRKATPVKAGRMGFILRHARHHAKQGDDGNRHIDQKHPVPTVILGQPATQWRSDDRPNHDAHTPHGHRRAMLLGRKSIQQ